jgi:amino acid adenylation domain-containing protein/non-ribosomal peptide synthase protein (TIGR01720 family)
MKNLFEADEGNYRTTLDFLLEAEGIQAPLYDPIEPRPAGFVRMSAGQRRLWFLQQTEPSSPAYNIAHAVRIRGPLKVEVLSACLQEIVCRHEVLRTTFRSTDAGPESCVHEYLPAFVSSLDLSALRLAKRESKIRQYIAEQARIPFDLATGPLIRMNAARLARREYVIVLVMHHIVADAWSMDVLVRELNKLYPAFEAGLPSPLRKLPIQYSDYSYWQWKKRDQFRSQLDFWRKQLHEAPELMLPGRHPHSFQQSVTGAVCPVQIPAELAEALNELGKTERATLFMTLLAAFQTLLSRFSQQTDIVVGTPVAGRNRSELEPLIGFFVNTLALRTCWSHGASFRDVLRCVRTTVLQAYEHQDVSFDEIVQTVLPGRSLSQNPLFQAMFSLEASVRDPLNLSGASIESETIETNVTKFDLTLNLAPTVSGLSGGLEYRSDLFSALMVERMAANFAQLLESICSSPDSPVAYLPIIQNEERNLLIYGFNESSAAPQASSLGALFAEQVRTRPDAIATEYDGSQRSYAELDRIASHWAAELTGWNIGLEDRVAIIMEPSFEMVVAVIAVIKAGAAYVPLVPSFPDHRLELILRDTQARVVLTQPHLAKRLSKLAVPVESLDLNARLDSKQLFQADVCPDQLAYIIYTSGSTGDPKGIAVTHRAIVRLVRDTDYIQLQPDDRIGQASNFAFDATTFELWGALLNGSCLVGIPRDTALDPLRLTSLLRDRQITTLFLTTALFNQIVRDRPDAFSSLRHLLFGGEAVDVDSVRTVLDSGAPTRLLHVYGPTECTTFASWYEVRQLALQDDTVPIGSSIANTAAYIVDRQGELVPMGVSGELWLGGVGLARGYAGRPDLTACAFVPDPFSGRVGERLYRTGDLVRWNDQAALEFLGRIDDQVKIRGYRIEPAEIASMLNKHEVVREAAVVVGEDKRLIAYVVIAQGHTFSSGDLRDYLSSHLPEYMIPRAFVELPRLPLTANGKIDRKALPPVAEEANTLPADELPRDERERVVAAAWCKVLHRESVGIRQNYFGLGGDSITAIQIVGLLRREGWDVQVRDLFQYPTIEKLVYHLQLISQPLEAKPLEPTAPLSPIQCWFFELHQGSLHHFNQSVLLKCRQVVEAERWQVALDAVWQRHDALRTVFSKTGTKVHQVLTDHGPDFSLVDLRGSGHRAIEEYANIVHRGFDLAHGPLFKSVLFRCEDADRIFLVAHHLIVDGVSWRILLEELQTAYSQIEQSIPINLGPRPTPWQQWVLELHEYARHELSAGEIAYWQEITRNAAQQLQPSVRGVQFAEGAVLQHSNAQSVRASGIEDDAPKAERQTPNAERQTPSENRFANVESVTLQLTEEETRGLLEEAGRAFHAEINDLLLAGLARALASWSNMTSTILTLEGHGREALRQKLEANTTVGWFTTLFPFRLEYTGAGIRDQIIATKEALRRVPNGGAGYGMLRYLAPREHPEHPQLRYAAVMSFNYLGRFEVGSSTALWEFVPEGMGSAIASDLSRQHDVDLTAVVLAGRLNVSVTFLPAQHSPASMTELLQQYRTQLVEITEYCCQRPPEKTVVDFSYEGLTQKKWEELIQRYGFAANEIQDVHSLTPLQEGLLFHALYDQDSRAYHLQMVFDLDGRFSLDALQLAWRDMEGRHAILRTAFVHDSVERPVQVILAERRNPVTVTHVPAGAEGAAFLDTERAADLKRGFDLARDPLSRLTIVRVDEQRAHLIWSCHHILLDGWSFGILLREFAELYHARLTGITLELPPPPAYSDYLRWINSRDRGASKAYWAEYLKGVETITAIPKSSRESAQSKTGPRAERVLEFTPKLTAKLRALAASQNATLNHLVQAIWALLLSRYNGTRDVVFGTIVSGRPPGIAAFESAVGLFINAVPVRTAVLPQSKFVELVQSIRDSALSSEPHHYLPLAEIQVSTLPGNDLINHLLIFENYPIEPMEMGDLAAASVAMRPRFVHDEMHYDFSIVVTPGDRLHLKLNYNADIYQEDQLARIAYHWETVANAVVEEPTRAIGSIDILSRIERETVVRQFNCSRPLLRAPTTISADIEQNAVCLPTAAAIQSENECLSYCELGARSNAIALALRQHEVRPGDRVGLLLDRSPALVASMLAAWKVRAAYVPIDPEYPHNQIEHILTDSRCRIVLTTCPGRVSLPCGCACLDPYTVPPSGGSSGLLSPCGEDAAYVIYTSGSTGTSKGCEVTHRNLANYLHWFSTDVHADDDAGSYGLFTSVAFDLTVTSIFTPLIRGRTLRIFTQDADPCDILCAVFSGIGGIDSVKCTPSHISLVKHMGVGHSPLRVCILGGEAVTRDQVEYLHGLNPHLKVYNEYGPTETTVGCIATVIPRGTSRILIGRPIANTQAYIFDRDYQLAPIGVAGEICIGGEGVSRGYLFRPELTADRFAPCRGGTRIYRTGDIGRWLPDGTMEYLGRNDDQVKIRGHRVELAEIRQALVNQPEVSEAVVVPRRSGGDTELIAYVAGQASAPALAAYCRETLPAHMVPAYFVTLDQLPLNSNGKLDRRRLPEPGECCIPERNVCPPNTATEKTLARIWQMVLGVGNIGVLDNFFDLGGHSLKAIQVLSRIHQDLDCKLALKDLFGCPNIESLAKRIAEQKPEALSAISPVLLQETYELSHAQKRLWLADQMDASRSVNTPQALLFRGGIDGGVLRRALTALIERHESLRTAFVLVKGEPRQKIFPVTELPIDEVDLRNDPNPAARAEEIGKQCAVERFDLSYPTPLRVTLILLPEDRTVLLLTMHHIVGDGWSHRLFWEELSLVYRAFAGGEPNPLEPLKIQYKDYAAWQNARSFATEENYWIRRLENVTDGILLPLDFPVQPKPCFSGAGEKLSLTAELTNEVRQLAKRNGSLASYVMLTLFKLVLFKVSRQSDLCVGLSCANRNHPAVERLIGFFVNILPVRTQLEGDMDFSDLLADVTASVTTALGYQDYPLDLLVQKLKFSRRANRPPLINVVFGFHDFQSLRFDITAKSTEAATSSGPEILGECDWAFSPETVNFDLTLIVTDNQTHFDLLLIYNRELFRPATAKRYLSLMEHLARRVIRRGGLADDSMR